MISKRHTFKRDGFVLVAGSCKESVWCSGVCGLSPKTTMRECLAWFYQRLQSISLLAGFALATFKGRK